MIIVLTLNKEQTGMAPIPFSKDLFTEVDRMCRKENRKSQMSSLLYKPSEKYQVHTVP